MATFARPDGTSIEVFYDQVVLPRGAPLGARDRGVSHYLGSAGRLRPDITVRVTRRDGSKVYTVFEIKLSDDVSYAASGYAEAIVYRHEYAPFLTGWPKAVRITSRATHGKPRRGDDVVALSWSELANAEIIDGILEGVG